MFEEDRRYYECITCGLSSNCQKLTKEHLFGDSFIKYIRSLQKTQLPWAVGSLQARSNGLKGVFKGSSWIGDVAPKLLCKICNNARLSGIMEDSLKSAISLYQGDSLSITGKSSHALSRYFERMGVLQDVMTSNLDLEKAQRTRKPITDANASFRSHAPLLSKQERLDWLDGGDVGFNIYIGRHNGVLGLGPFLNIARHASLPEFRDYGYGKRFTYVIGKLVAVIELKNNSRKIPTSLFRLSRDKLEIPDDVFVGYKEIISLQNRDLYMATLNFWFSQPLLKDVIESESKDRGALMWPEFLESITPTDLAAVVAATPLADRWWSDTI